MKKAGGHHGCDGRLYRMLRGTLEFCLRHRFMVIGTTVAMFAGSVVAFGFVQQQFFPTSTRPELFLEIRLPEGTSITVTEATAKKAEALVGEDPDVATSTTYVGRGAPRFWLGLNPVLPNPNFAQIVIVAKDVAARERLKARLDAELAGRALGSAGACGPLRVRPAGGLPGAVPRGGAGPHRGARHRREGALGDGIGRGHDRPAPQLGRAGQVHHPDRRSGPRTRARYLAARHRRDAADPPSGLRHRPTARGETCSSTSWRAPCRKSEVDLEHLAALTVTTRNGLAVPLGQVARIGYAHEEPILWRRDRDLVLTVRGDVRDGVQPPDVTTRLLPKLAQLKAELPPGYRIETGGSIEESAKANASLAAVFPVMIIVMLTLLMIQLQSFSRLALVLASGALGLIGAAAALLIAHRPFGFVALLGLIALAGMIMRNTVILVDQIDYDIRDGATPHRAIVEATLRRARPVVLTALAAVLGMIPLAESVFWGPMAVTIMGGLLVATVLTLLVVPALYATWFRVKVTDEGDRAVRAAARRRNDALRLNQDVARRPPGPSASPVPGNAPAADGRGDFASRMVCRDSVLLVAQGEAEHQRADAGDDEVHAEEQAEDVDGVHRPAGDGSDEAQQQGDDAGHHDPAPALAVLGAETGEDAEDALDGKRHADHQRGRTPAPSSGLYTSSRPPATT